MSDTPPPLPFQTPPERGQWRLVLLVAAIALPIVVLGFFWLGNPFQSATAPASQPLPPLDAETVAYARAIGFDQLELSRWQNFLGQSVIYLDGRVTNGGNRSLRALELTIEFLDPYNQVVLRESFRPIGAPRPSPADPRSAPLAPGESRAFRAAF
ncbi:MAG: hypothetical protein ACRD4D_08085 [Candidatus Acidiferrales bacterium]